jgi:hypothetical protein
MSLEIIEKHPSAKAQVIRASSITQVWGLSGKVAA